jgi:nucleoside-diphosphate-sugar epimerase
MLIIASSYEYSIKEVAQIISRRFSYEDSLKFDDQFSDGQFRKTVDNSRLMNFIGEDFPFTHITTGINAAIDFFLTNYETCRK